MRKKPWYKGRWGIVLLVLGFLLFITACSSTTPSTKETGTKEKTEQAAPKEEKTEFGVGEVIKLNNHELTVNSVDKNYQSTNEFDKPQKPENGFVVVNITLKNTSDKDLTINEFGFKLEDDTGTKRNTTLIAGMEGRMEWAELAPNGTNSGNLPFEAKANSQTLKLHYSPGVAGGKEIVVNL